MISEPKAEWTDRAFPFVLPPDKEFAEGMQPGSLYLVATPIGNLRDISLRALQVLALVDIVAAEDTRRTGRLLQAYGLKKPLISCYAHNEEMQGKRIVELLQEGKTVALVSDAGMPGISDPGARLVRQVLDAGLRLSVLPGASAGITALAGSGLDTTTYAFCGFFPRGAKDKATWLARFGDFDGTLVFYESPKRLTATLTTVLEAFGDRYCCVARELTKRHEEYIRGPLTEIIQGFAQVPTIKGEVVVVMEGYKGQGEAALSDAEILAMGVALLESGLGKKEASRRLAERTGMSAKACYALLLQTDDKAES